MEWENTRKGEDVRLCRGSACRRFTAGCYPLLIPSGPSPRPAISALFIEQRTLLWVASSTCVANTLSSGNHVQCIPTKAAALPSSFPHSPSPRCRQRDFLRPSAAALVKVYQLVHRAALPRAVWLVLLFIVRLFFSFLREVSLFFFPFYISFC